MPTYTPCECDDVIPFSSHEPVSVVQCSRGPRECTRLDTHTNEEYDTWCEERHTVTNLGVSLIIILDFVHEFETPYDRDKSMSPINASLLISFYQPSSAHARAPHLRSLPAAPSHIYYPTKHVVVTIVTWAQRSPCSALMTASRRQEGQLATDTKNGWRNGEGYIAFGKSSASLPSFLIATTP